MNKPVELKPCPLDEIHTCRSFLLAGLENKVRDYVDNLYSKKKQEICEELDRDAEKQIMKILKELKTTITSNLLIDRKETKHVIEVIFNGSEIK